MIFKVSRDVSDSEMWDGSSGGVEKQSDSGYILKTELTGPTDALDMGAMRAFKVQHGLGKVQRQERAWSDV